MAGSDEVIEFTLGQLCGSILARIDGRVDAQLNPEGDLIKSPEEQRRVIKGTKISENIDGVLSRIKPDQLAEIAEAYILKLEPDLTKDCARVKNFKEHCKKYKRGAQTRVWMNEQRKNDRNSRATAEKNKALQNELDQMQMYVDRTTLRESHYRQAQLRMARRRSVTKKRNRTPTITRSTQTPPFKTV